MFQTIARSAVIGMFGPGTLLGAPRPRSLIPTRRGRRRLRDYMDDDLPPSVAMFDRPDDLTYYPPGYDVADNAIQIPGVPMGCEPSIPVVAVPSAILAPRRPAPPPAVAMDVCCPGTTITHVPEQVGIFAVRAILGAFLPPILRSRRCIAVNGPT